MSSRSSFTVPIPPVWHACNHIGDASRPSRVTFKNFQERQMHCQSALDRTRVGSCDCRSESDVHAKRMNQQLQSKDPYPKTDL
jgi:hypothetical protein